MAAKSCAPAETSALNCAMMSGSRGGALVARMNSAKTRMSWSTSSPQMTLEFGGLRYVLSGTVSKPEPNPTKRPSEVFSLRIRKFVMPISLRKASPEKESKLPCWSFQPKRPTRRWPLYAQRNHRRFRSIISKTSIHLVHPSPQRKSLSTTGVYFLLRFWSVIGIRTGKDYVNQVGNGSPVFRIFFEFQSFGESD